ncbi:MAG: ECF transporter S component [Ardenticatenia bacterium]|nr:ECF transporter S component [Ardenticatenia bacterium]
MVNVPGSRPSESRGAQVVGHALLTLAGVAGLAAFFYPFFWPQIAQVSRAEATQAHAGDAPLLFTLLVVASITVVVAELESSALTTRSVALLGVLVAFNAALRLAETVTSFLNLGGFSPVFVLIILGGYVYGSRFGFLVGALSLLVGGMLTGGVGPWLPFQMVAAGWVGLTSGWLPVLLRFRPTRVRLVRRREVVALAAFGGMWGFLYGFLMNLYFWPFVSGEGMYWRPGMGWQETFSRYVLFYAVTSVAWDSARAVGNVLLIGLLGEALLKALRRFQLRFFPLPHGNWDPPAPDGRRLSGG